MLIVFDCTEEVNYVIQEYFKNKQISLAGSFIKVKGPEVPALEVLVNLCLSKGKNMKTFIP